MTSKLALIRQQNILLLLQNWSTKKKFAEACLLSPSQLSNMIKQTNFDAVGNDIARRIEQANNLNEGWLDRPQIGIGYSCTESELNIIIKSAAAAAKALAQDEGFNLATMRASKIEQIFLTASTTALQDSFGANMESVDLFIQH